jgi:hypothetical protein
MLPEPFKVNSVSVVGGVPLTEQLKTSPQDPVAQDPTFASLNVQFVAAREKYHVQKSTIIQMNRTCQIITIIESISIVFVHCADCHHSVTQYFVLLSICC